MNEPTAEPIEIGAESQIHARPVILCRHLRHKGMYVYPDGLPADHDDSASIFWCLRSMTAYGPDDESIGREPCADPNRPCYEES
jgi:hypothetical protein